MDKYTLRQNIADYTCKHFFDGTASLKGKIIKDLAVLDSDFAKWTQRIVSNFHMADSNTCMEWCGD